MATEEQVLAALRGVQVPDLHQDVVTLGMVKNFKMMHGIVAFTLELNAAGAGFKDRLMGEARDAVKAVPGVADVAVHVTILEKPPAPASQIKHIIAVGSGKGGVGKSTVAANLAIALAETGAKVGLLDADIYGPSVPMMMGVPTQRPAVKDDKLQPIQSHGIKLMSMGFLLPNPEDPVVWRGPMLAGALKQFLNDVAWGELDYLLVDLPPGTGDIPLSLVQAAPLTGAIIVITPQPVATSIGIKTLRMLQQTHAPILGIIENMSAFVCGHCHQETPIFDRGGGRLTSEREGVPFLGEIPLDPKIRVSGDEGRPLMVADPQAPQAEAFRRVAKSLVEAIANAPAAGAHAHSHPH
jgi:ATP-binding protein involved in chromosome partitioning